MYNIASYIRYCLESCMHQDGAGESDYEIIVVNDGSTDDGLSIAEECAAAKSNVRIISQDNAGLSSARNTGMRNAQGEYIWFVDGDDAVSGQAVSHILSNIDAHPADAYICNFSTFESGDLLETSHFQTYNNLSGKEIHEKHLHILPMMAWLTIYRTDSLIRHGLEFFPGIYHEDLEFSVRAHHCMDSIFFIEESLYYYRIARTDSIMDSIKKDNTRSLLSEIAIIDSFSAFFGNKQSAFVKKLFGVCATAFLTKYYGSSSVPGETVASLYRDNKGRLYKMMWHSGRWKMRALLLMTILLPRPLLSRVYSYVGSQAKLM